MTVALYSSHARREGVVVWAAGWLPTLRMCNVTCVTAVVDAPDETVADASNAFGRERRRSVATGTIPPH